MRPRRNRRLIVSALILCLFPLCMWWQAEAQLSQSLSQQAYVVLRQNCFGCHGAARTSELDLRTADGVLAGGENGKVIVPGDPQASRLFQFVTHQEKPTMPPGKKLS
ncbi:MAG: c-type cytochrome domain-containing protein, partial [Acidobacteriota bacterium]